MSRVAKCIDNGPMAVSYTHLVPCAGNLYYRGYNIKDLVQGFLKDEHYGFEEIAYLLLFGELPNEKELSMFLSLIHIFWE